MLSACGVPQADYDKLNAEAVSLRAQIDELENGEARLLTKAKQSIETENLTSLRSHIKSLEDNHPQSVGIDALKDALATMEAKRAERAAFVEASRLKEQADADRNKTGIWSLVYYTDEFGELTKDAIVWNTSLIKGKFSNSATQDSPLNIRIIVDGPREVDIKLYEYAGNNPVKAYRAEEYIVSIQDKDGERERLIATNRGDRLSFGPKHSTIVTKALSKGGTVKLNIVQTETPTTQYSFVVSEAKFFDNAMRLLSEK